MDVPLAATNATKCLTKFTSAKSGIFNYDVARNMLKVPLYYAPGTLERVDYQNLIAKCYHIYKIHILKVIFISTLHLTFVVLSV